MYSTKVILNAKSATQTTNFTDWIVFPQEPIGTLNLNLALKHNEENDTVIECYITNTQRAG